MGYVCAGVLCVVGRLPVRVPLVQKQWPVSESSCWLGEVCHWHSPWSLAGEHTLCCLDGCRRTVLVVCAAVPACCVLQPLASI